MSEKCSGVSLIKFQPLAQDIGFFPTKFEFQNAGVTLKKKKPPKSPVAAFFLSKFLEICLSK